MTFEEWKRGGTGYLALKRIVPDHLKPAALDGFFVAVRRVCDKTQFPIASKNEDQFEALATKRIPHLSAEHRALIKHLQPYHAGDEAHRHPLAIPSDLSNADKHRLINPTFSFMASDTRDARTASLSATWAGTPRSAAFT